MFAVGQYISGRAVCLQQGSVFAVGQCGSGRTVWQ